MKKKLPNDNELSLLLATKSNVEIANLFDCSSSAVSLHRKRLGIPLPLQTKKCCRCGKEPPDVWFHKDASRADGLSTYCKSCQVDKNREARQRNPTKHRLDQNLKYDKNRDARIANAKSVYARNKDQVWEKNINRNYGISKDDYEALMQKQGGCCAICGTDVPRTTAKRLFVDHCHATGKIRGLLCGNCNSLLGHAKDNPKILERAKQYLG